MTGWISIYNHRGYDLVIDWSCELDKYEGICEIPEVNIIGGEDEIKWKFEEIIDNWLKDVIEYKGFELKVYLNVKNGKIYGKVLPNERNFSIDEKDLIAYEFDDVKEAFEKEIDLFYKRKFISENSYKYKGVTLEVYPDEKKSTYFGSIKNDIYKFRFSGKDIECIKKEFEKYVDELERHCQVLSKLRGEKTK